MMQWIKKKKHPAHIYDFCIPRNITVSISVPMMTMLASYIPEYRQLSNSRVLEGFLQDIFQYHA